MLGLLIRCVVLIGLKIVEAICLILSFFDYFKKPKRCPAITDEILLHPAGVLAEKIRKREISSETVIKAYISRIKAVNPILNAVVEDRFDLAINEAKEVDQMISNTNESLEDLARKYPLLGLPLTVKESIAVEGLSNCAGKVLPNGKKARKDADVVRLCRSAGAIPLLVSNTPEMCGNWETYNNVTGRTNNPYDTRRTTGGSSGGEGALLGSGASLIGVGSDLFGSIRLPAHYCGIWGHKPSSNIIPISGHYPGCKDTTLWNQIFTLGPMCRYAIDLPLILNAVLNDDARHTLQLYKEIPLSTIKFYYMDNDGGSIITNRIDKEITTGISKLISHMATKYACTVQKLQMEEFKYSAELGLIKIFTINDIEELSEDNGEGSFAELIQYLTFRSNSVLPLMIYRMVKYSTGFLPKSVVPYCNEILNQMKTKLCKVLGTNGVLVYPCHPTAAHIHGQMYGRVFDYSYLGIFNCLGLPVTACPLGLNSDGLPFGIQVVAASNNDGLTLAVAQEIEKAFGGWVPPPFSNELTH